jgi:hypothetical protein
MSHFQRSRQARLEHKGEKTEELTICEILSEALDFSIFLYLETCSLMVRVYEEGIMNWTEKLQRVG